LDGLIRLEKGAQVLVFMLRQKVLMPMITRNQRCMNKMKKKTDTGCNLAGMRKGLMVNIFSQLKMLLIGWTFPYGLNYNADISRLSAGWSLLCGFVEVLWLI